MFDFGKKICKWVVELLAQVSNLFTDKMQNLAIIDIKEFAPTVYEITKQINEIVVIPIASVLIIFTLGYEIIDQMLKYNQSKETSLEEFVTPGAKLIFSLMFISYAYDLFLLIIQLGRWMSLSAKALLNNIFKNGLDKDALTKEIDKLSNGEAIGLAMLLLIVLIVLIGANIFSYVYILTWIFEMYIMLTTSSLSAGTVLSEKYKNIGEGQIKTIMRLAIQGFLFVVVIGIYFGVMKDIKLDGGGIILTLTQVIVPPLVLCVLIKKTGDMAEAIIPRM